MHLQLSVGFPWIFFYQSKNSLLDSVCSRWKNLQTITKLLLSILFDILNLNRLTLWSHSILQTSLSFIFLWFFSELPLICQHLSWVADIRTDIVAVAFTNAKCRSNTTILVPLMLSSAYRKILHWPFWQHNFRGLWGLADCLPGPPVHFSVSASQRKTCHMGLRPEMLVLK